MIKNILYFILICILLAILMYFSNKNNEHFAENVNKNFFDNKVILITGSSKGIGFEIAKLLSKYNSKLVIHGKTEKTLKEALDILTKKNSNVIGITADLSKEENIDKLFAETIDQFQRIDILINNVSSKKSSHKLTDQKFEDWKTDIDVNVNSIFKLTQKVINHMKRKYIKGKIINLSSNVSKDRDTRTNIGSEIISKSFIERISDILADENFKQNITIGTIRIDNSSKSNNTQFSETVNNFFNNYYDTNDNIAKTILNIIKLPHHELTGKLYTTSTFSETPELSKLVPSYNLALNKNVHSIFDHYKKEENKNYMYLTTQNPYGLSKNLKTVLSSYNFNKSKFNIKTEYNNKLNTILSKKLKINGNKITFYKNQYEALKRIIHTFVPKYNNVFSLYPSHEYLELLSNENKFEIKYTIFKVNSTSIQPKFEHITNYITPKTKLIYLSSPNLISGQLLMKSDFEQFINQLPKNIIVLIDQTYIDFVNKNEYKENHLNPLKLNNSNVIILRTFSNFYGFENLELSYVIASPEISKILRESNVIENQIDNFNESLSIECLKDTKHSQFIKKKINLEKKRIYDVLEENEIPFFPSEANYILINPTKNKETIISELKDNNIIFNDQNLFYDKYWCLPISIKKINDKVLDIIISNF